MSIAANRVDSSREYVCDGCGSAVAAVPVFRRLLGEHQFGAVWNADPEPPGPPAPVCAFCSAHMETRSLQAGRAAICHTCQVVWFDQEALASLSSSVPQAARLSEVGVSKCAYCGAPISSSLDDRCRYCGTALELPVSQPA